ADRGRTKGVCVLRTYQPSAGASPRPLSFRKRPCRAQAHITPADVRPVSALPPGGSPPFGCGAVSADPVVHRGPYRGGGQPVFIATAMSLMTSPTAPCDCIVPCDQSAPTCNGFCPPARGVCIPVTGGSFAGHAGARCNRRAARRPGGCG